MAQQQQQQPSAAVLACVQCVPSRRSIKFTPGPQARNFISFDTTISKWERIAFFMELFSFQKYMVDHDVLPCYEVAAYAPEELVEIRVVSDPRHPAYGQAGLYAKKTIPSGTIVTPYSGLIEIFGTSCNSRTYTMGFGSLSDDYALDAEFTGNYGRFANDPRGVEGLAANLSAESKYNNRGESFTALVARRQIYEGEEILMSYGKAHSLSPSPWTNVRGELTMRSRYGGSLPFPLLAAPPAKATKDNSSNNNNNENSAHVATSSIKEEDNTPEQADSSNNNHNTKSSNTVQTASASYQICWECMQCGMWNPCISPEMVRMEHCVVCGSPKLSGAKLVSLLSAPAVTVDDIRACVGTVAPSRVNDALVSSVMGNGAASRDGAAAGVTAGGAGSASPAPSDTSATPPDGTSSNNGTRRRKRGRPPATGTATSRVTTPITATVAVGSPTSPTHSTAHTYRSEHADWPMNIPFLPWQVWDTAVPIVAIGKHAKYETHENVFLYTVQRTTASEGGGGGGGGGSSDEGGDSHHEHSSHSDTHTHRGPRRTSRWEKEVGEVALPKDDSIRSPHVSPTCEGGGYASSSPGSPYNGDPSCTTTAAAPAALGQSCTSPLQRVLGMPREVERFILLQAHNSTALSPVCYARRLLQRMTRRVFTGKDFRPGEVVGYMGGCIRHSSDRRVRPDGSPLAIPMQYLLPTVHRQHLMNSLCRQGDGGTAAVIKDDDDEGMVRDEVERSAHDFLSHLEQFSFVVTNELMYCPCLAVADDGDNKDTSLFPVNEKEKTPPSACEDVELGQLIQACNAALVFAMDSLGSPNVAVVATRHINAFEALLVRMQ